MIRALSIGLAATCIVAVPCLAVDGIAVSTQLSLMWPTSAGGDLIRYDIRNSDVIRVTTLLDGGGGDASKSKNHGRFPAISFDGTQIAFFRCPNDSGYFVSIMNIDGTAMHDLTKIPNQAGFDGKGYLHWALSGGKRWIYYMMAGDNATNEGNKQLWRINADAPAQNEKVVQFQYGLWQFGMSADASRMILRLSSNQPPGEVFLYTLPGNGTVGLEPKVDYGVGCATALSPSGQWFTYALGGGHTSMGVESWDMTNKYWFESAPDINSWAVNSPELSTHCVWSSISGGITVSLGMGTDCNRWSCNSDKWVCYFMGWPEGDGGSGRYGFCGSNQVVINWQDHIAVNTSRNVRSCQDQTMISECDKNVAGSSQYRRNDAGDFFISSPLEDVNADLRASVASNHVSDGMASARPQAVLFRDSRQATIDITESGPYHVAISDPSGRTILSQSGNGPAAVCVSAHHLPPVAVVSLVTSSGVRSMRMISREIR